MDALTPLEVRANAFLKALAAELGPKHPLVHEAAHTLMLAYAEMEKP